MASQKDILASLSDNIEKSDLVLGSLADTIQKLIPVMDEFLKIQKNNSDAKKDNTDNTKKNTNALSDFTNKVKGVGSELLKITDAGIKFASAIGTTATSGVQLEVQNRLSLLGQLTNFNANQQVSLAQLQSAQQSFTDTFISTREGFQLSSAGAIAFAQNLKGGFKSEFQLTAQSLQALITTGVSTTAEFEKLRAASGRAGLSGNQLANIVNKNSLSFLLFGNSFAKAAADADKLGISLSAVQAQQEAYVTNLDGAIDTVAQLNQIGATLDFGTLTKLQEMGDPAKVLAYINANTQALNFNMSSIRALAKGITNPEDLLKLRGKPTEAANSIEEQMTERAKAESALSTAATLLGKGFTLARDTFWGLASSATMATVALYRLAFTASSSTGKAGMSAIGTGLLGQTLGVGAGLTSGYLGGSALGTAMGATPEAAGTGALIGSGLATLVALLLAPETGGLSLALLGAAGGLAGGGFAGFASRKGDDIISSAGYGDRQLVTPTGTIALNNNDTVMAGTNLLSKGALSPESNARTEQLHNKLDTLIGTLNNATTTINVDGQTSTVPRMSVTGVYTRSEKR